MTLEDQVVSHTDNHYSSHKTLYNLNANIYKQHDSQTGRVLNCGTPQKRPMQIALENTFIATSAPTFTEYKTLAFGNCDGSKYSNTVAYPEINDQMTKEYKIFNRLYIEQISDNLNCSNLVPVLDDSVQTVSCPTSYIPYVLEYSLYPKDLKHARFCLKPDNVKKIVFSTIGDFKVFRYLDKNSDLPCQTNVCNTKYPPVVGHNLEYKPVISKRNDQKSGETTSIILGVVNAIILIALIVVIYFITKPKNKNESIKKENLRN